MRHAAILILSILILFAAPFSSWSRQDPSLILTAPHWTNGQLQFTLTGQPNITYTIEGSSNGVTWLPLLTNTSINSERLITVAPIADSGFYRVRRPLICTTNRNIFALKLQEGIELNGNSILIDSFNSTDPNYSDANGYYDPAKRKDGGNVISNGGITNSLNFGNAALYGKVSIPIGASINLGPNGSIGSLSWHNAAHTGIEPGWLTHDASADFPYLIDPPFGTTPSGGVVNGTAYQYILSSGTYQVSNLTGGVYVTGISTLFVTTGATFTASSSAQIVLGPGASLQIHSYAASVQFSGKAIVNNGTAANFGYRGAPENKNLSLTSGFELLGVINAPNAAVTITGNGMIQGAIVAKSFAASGVVSIHCDESLFRSLIICR